MEKKWLKYLSEQDNKELVPIMSEYFNDEIDFEELNEKVYSLGLTDFYLFKKGLIIDDILGED